MEQILIILPVLGVAIVINILLGMYAKIGIEKLSFSMEILINGVVKAVIIAISFIGLSYCADVVDLSQIGVTSESVMNAAILLYVGKDIMNLGKCLGIDVEKLKG